MSEAASETLNIANDLLKNIPVTFHERRWMRSQKAWRCYLGIPSEELYPAIFTGMMESRARITLQCDGMTVVVDPAYIIDVPSSKKGKEKRLEFTLIMETCYETQAALGPRLTELTDKKCSMTVEPTTEKPQPAPQRENREAYVDKDVLWNLHLKFFQNPKFWTYLKSRRPEVTITNAEECKTAFKAIIGIQSTKDLLKTTFAATIQDFNEYLRRP